MIKISNLLVNVFCVMLSLSNSSSLGMGIPQSPGAEALLRKSENVLRKDALRKIEPQYPPIARTARAQGEVKVELVIDVRIYLGMALKAKGDNEAAIVALKESVAIQPHPNALFLLGEIYLGQNRWKEAIESYKQSLELEDGPHVPPSHYGLGIAFLRMSDKQSAMTHYQELKKLNNKRAEQLLFEINK